MVRFEVVDGFAKDEGPEVLAEEFDGVEGGLWSGLVGGESAHKYDTY